MAIRASEIFRERRPKRLVLAGGSTPRRAYELIAELPGQWGETDLYLSDERWVPEDDERSNVRMIREAFAKRVQEATVHMIYASGTPEEAAASYADRVKDALPFDLAFLGIGADGHTASLFPELDNYDRRDVLAFAFFSERLKMWRVTLSLRALNASRHVVFLVTGEEKSEALAAVFAGKSLPAARVRPAASLTILADRAAAQLVRTD